jgi:hypothetical protein
MGHTYITARCEKTTENVIHAGMVTGNNTLFLMLKASQKGERHHCATVNSSFYYMDVEEGI